MRILVATMYSKLRCRIRVSKEMGPRVKPVGASRQDEYIVRVGLALL